MCAVALAALTGFPESFEFASGDLRLAFGDNGRVTGLTDTAGRKYLSAVSPWVSRIGEDGKRIFAEKAAKRADGALVFSFADGSEVVESVEPFDGGFVFTVVGCTVPDGFRSLALALMRPDCRKYTGSFACISSDDERAVCLRSFDYAVQMSVTADSMSVDLCPPVAAQGVRFGLTAGPREGILPRLRSLVKASGLAYSEAGGPWSLGSRETRQSYMFANMNADAADAWIDAAVRAGISIVHLHNWQYSLGHYDVNPKKYRDGMATLKSVADRIRAAGMNVSMHTLTACIDFHDGWVTPVAHSNLIATYTYTLAAPLTKDSKEVVVNELPGPKHDVVMTYTSNGNALEIDGELVTYTGIRRERPCAFTGITRGAYGTTVRDHAAGARTKYLQQRYFSFYPEVDSPLADELADRLAAVYNGIGADMIYFDGSEGMKSPYATAKMAAKIASRLDRTRHPPRIEMSCTQPHFWPFRATIGAWDNVRYGAKPFEDDHIRSNAARGRMSNFIETQMGWWQPQMPGKDIRCRFPDETEYFAAKNAGADSAMSLQGLNANVGYLPDLQEKALTVIGWYERFRLAQAFADDVRADLAALGREGRLEQDATGAWTYSPVVAAANRVRGEGVGTKWTVTSASAGAADLRIEAFYNLSRYESPVARKVFDPETLPKAAKRSAKGVSATAEAADDLEFGKVTRLTAFNDSGRRRGAWTVFERTFEGPEYLNLDGAVGVGFWVKGDGSGAILDVQLQNPREYASACRADHLVKLDFKGWKYVELLFRERDIDEYVKYEWPFWIGHPEYMCALRPKFVQAVRLLLNEIPVSAAEGVLDGNSEDASSRAPSVDVAISDVKALALKETTCEDVTLKLNGERIAVPFEFAAGDWAELRSGVWNQYDEKGAFKARASGPELRLRAGANACAYSAKASERAAARAEVTFFVRGAARPALKALTDGMRKELAWEAEMPAEWAPSKGADTLPPVKVRPGEKARLEVKVRGPVADPVLTVNGQAWKLGSVPAKTVRTFTDGPVISGVADVKLESSDPAAADALVEFVKRYGR